MNIMSNGLTIRKSTKIGLQCYFYNYYNHSAPPVNISRLPKDGCTNFEQDEISSRNLSDKHLP